MGMQTDAIYKSIAFDLEKVMIEVMENGLRDRPGDDAVYFFVKTHLYPIYEGCLAECFYKENKDLQKFFRS